MKQGIGQLGPQATKGLVHVVVETVKGARTKLKYDPERGLFRLHKVLPKGFSWPYDFGFIPGTKGGDGDPLDVLVLMEEPAVVGCLLEARPIGVVKLLDNGQRNDRIVAVWPPDELYGDLSDFSELPHSTGIAIERFFRLYPAVRGDMVEFLGTEEAESAARMIKAQARG